MKKFTLLILFLFFISCTTGHITKEKSGKYKINTDKFYIVYQDFDLDFYSDGTFYNGGFVQDTSNKVIAYFDSIHGKDWIICGDLYWKIKDGIMWIGIDYIARESLFDPTNIRHRMDWYTLDYIKGLKY